MKARLAELTLPSNDAGRIGNRPASFFFGSSVQSGHPRFQMGMRGHCEEQMLPPRSAAKRVDRMNFPQSGRHFAVSDRSPGS